MPLPPRVPAAARDGLASPRLVTFLVGILLIVAGVYLIQVVSPLRLNGDAMDYLTLAASAADGHGFTEGGEQSRYPPGYPALVAAALLAGVPMPPTLVLLNLASLGLAMALTFSIARRAFEMSVSLSIGGLLLVLLSFVLIKHVTLPMAESVFLAASTAALYGILTIESTRGTERVAWGCLTLVLIVGAVALRTIGVALVPAFVFVLGRIVWDRFVALKSRKEKAIVLGSLAFVLGGPFVYVVVQSVYFDDFTRIVFGYAGTAGVLSRNVGWKLLEWGELAMNVPLARLPRALDVPVALLGLATLGLVGYGMLQRRGNRGAVEVYFLAYAAILFVWPGRDARFWLPVLPLIALFALSGVQGLLRFRFAKPVLGLYLLGYALAGAASLAYSTSISLAGSDFPYRYGDGHLTSTYLWAYEGETGEGPVRPRALRLLRRYEPALHPDAYSAPP